MSILITGMNGQDGRILSEYFKANGEKVFGIARDQVSYPHDKKHQVESVKIDSSASFNEFLDFAKPKSIFHLAASHANSTEMKIHGEKAQMEMFSVHVEATRIILDWQSQNLKLKTKLVVALSSQMYTANANLTWIDESTALSPSTKYGQTKSRAYELIREYRSKYGVYATGAILFNHSSRFSKPDFVLVEIARQIIEVLSGESNKIVLRNFDSEIDISDAESICKALVSMLSLEKPEDFVLASGTPTNLRNLTLDCLDWYKVTRKIELISTNSIRTAPKTLVGNSKKASAMLNWNPTHDPVTLLVSIVDNLVELALND